MLDGKITFGPYELLGRLSPGGMADVHRARDTRPEANGRLVALKTILASAHEDDELARMFEDEARIAATLDHPHIARLLEWGAHDDRMFIAYELVEGKDLRFLFENAALTGDRLPLPVVVHVIARVAEALAYAHARPSAIVHRDVSPQNVVVSFDGDVKLIDFGIAKAKGRLSRTAAGTIKGKFGYMSPEQVRGEEVDQRTDVFSLGICAWELLTLKRLFLPSTLSAAEASVNEILVLDMVKHHFPDPPSSFVLEVPFELDRIVMKALAKNPDERYKSARELYRDLYAFIENHPGQRARATRDDVATAMRQSFGAHEKRAAELQAGASTIPHHEKAGRIMDLQETRMSDENKGGSDLDIFEGLGKKNSERSPAAPPPPPGSGSHVAARPVLDGKKTLLGIPAPAATSPSLPRTSDSGIPSAPPASARPSAPPSGRIPAHPASSPSGSMRAVAAPSSPSKPPPPPPGRGSLPNLAATQPSSQAPPPVSAAPPPRASAPPPVPPPASTRPGPAGLVATGAAPVTKRNGGKLDMDWDDDDEATHVFDKDKEKSAPSVTTSSVAPEPERASMEKILSSPPSAPAPAAGSSPPASGPAPATLSGAFASLGQPSNGSSAFKSAPPASQSMRSAPPPPPASSSLGGPRPRSASTSTHPMPPPPPPGQTTTAPMHMPPQAPVPSQHPSQHPSHHPSQHPSGAPSGYPSAAPQPQLPPVGRNMEATAVVPRAASGSKVGPIVAVLLGVALLAAAAVFLLMPRTATLVVNVSDAKGAPVKGLQVSVDGTPSCDKSPCIVADVTAGVHEVQVSAPGYEPLSPLAISIEARKDVSKDFTLTPSKSSGGTGFKVAGNQPGVKLVVDGKEIGPLPQELGNLDPGEHKLKFVGGDRYAPLEKTISVGKDEIVDVGTIALKVLKGKATIQLGTPGAKVYLVLGNNRKEVPQFPMGIEFDPNERWMLEATKDGHEEFKQPITWDDGQAEKTFTVTLTPKGQTPAPVAAAPAVRAPAAAAPAKPASFLKGESSGDKEAAAAPAKPEPTPKKEAAAPAAGEAFLNINSLPASTVVLDGKPLGPTPKLKVSVSPGSHTIMFVNAEQSLKKSISVDVKAGETKAAFAKLRD